jgi:hypothetical protein
MVKKAHMLAALFAWARAPLGIFLIGSAVIQFVAAFYKAILPDALGVPDIIPAANTTILALLWWRLSRLEEWQKRLEDRDEERLKRRNAARLKGGKE